MRTKSTDKTKDEPSRKRSAERNVLLRIKLSPSGSLGPGKVELLEKIETEGSISAAARAMGMAYRRAWLHVDSLNRCFGRPVLIADRGGAQGGGAELTELGKELVERFRHMESLAEKALGKDVLALLAQLPQRGRKRG
jgi:molybdate transport system regulatory protein